MFPKTTQLAIIKTPKKFFSLTCEKIQTYKAAVAILPSVGFASSPPILVWERRETVGAVEDGAIELRRGWNRDICNMNGLSAESGVTGTVSAE